MDWGPFFAVEKARFGEVPRTSTWLEPLLFSLPVASRGAGRGDICFSFFGGRRLQCASTARS